MSELVADTLAAGDYFAEGISRDMVAAAVNRTLTQAQSEWKLYMQSQIRSSVSQVSAAKSRKKKKKSSKPRKRTPYNMYVKSQSASIRAELKLAAGDEQLKRGATMKEAGARWLALDTAAREPYVALAHELNATLKTQPVAVFVTPVAPPTEYAELVGPYPNTYTPGVVVGAKKSFKTLDNAVAALRNHPNAAAIVQTKNGGRFKLRAGFSGKRNHPNVDANGTNTPGFVFNANTGECTWVRKSAIDSYAKHGPFTKSNPFCAPAAAAVPTTPVAAVVTQAASVSPVSHPYQKVAVVGAVVSDGVYDKVVDGGTLPAEYVELFNGED